MKSFLVAILCFLLSITTVVIPAQAQCDGLPHPDKGQPAPCWQTPDPNARDRANAAAAAAFVAQAQKQAEEAAKQQAEQKRERVRQCELQAQHDYEECTRLHPNSPCPLKPCANTL